MKYRISKMVNGAKTYFVERDPFSGKFKWGSVEISAHYSKPRVAELVRGFCGGDTVEGAE